MCAACAESAYEGFFNGDQVQGSTFRLEAAEAGRKYRVFLSSEDAKAGGVFESKPRRRQADEVTLHPWAPEGRYVYDGALRRRRLPTLRASVSTLSKTPEGNAALNLPFYDNFSGHLHVQGVTDAEGNFELDGIVPGAFIYLNLNNEFKGRQAQLRSRHSQTRRNQRRRRTGHSRKSMSDPMQRKPLASRPGGSLAAL